MNRKHNAAQHRAGRLPAAAHYHSPAKNKLLLHAPHCGRNHAMPSATILSPPMVAAVHSSDVASRQQACAGNIADQAGSIHALVRVYLSLSLVFV